MSFLSNFNMLVGILLGPADLLESNEDMKFSISVLPLGLRKKETLGLFFKKILEIFMRKWNFLKLLAINWRKIVVENIWDCHWIGNSGIIYSKTPKGISKRFFNT